MYFIRVLSDSVCFRSFFLRSLVDKLFEFCGQYLTSTIIPESMREICIYDMYICPTLILEI